MKRTLLLALLGCTALGLRAQAPENSTDVLLQGFYWNSQTVTGWTQLTSQAAEIGQYFTGIWLPPSAEAEGGNTVGGTNVGYHPRTWNNQNSCWGTSDDLKTLISTLHDNGVKVIADIVVNHRSGYTGWGDFAPDDFGSYGSFQLTAAHICNTDEMNTDASAGTWYGTATGAADTGENWGGARDLDHTSTTVQQDITAYLNWLKGEYGYDGWRYDYTKGFDGSYVGLYNDSSSPWLSVSEYWDGGYDACKAWLEAASYKSMTFDFPAKYAIFNNGLAAGNYANMSWIEDNTTWRPAGLIHHASTNRYAVTFVDNHDTYRDSNKYTGDVAQAYAVLLTAPGVPCVFWPHWSGNKYFLRQIIAARRTAGIHSQSDAVVTQRSTYYECQTTGTNGTLICRVGNAAPTDVPDGYYLACKAGNTSAWWAIYLPTELQTTYTGLTDAVTAATTADISVSGHELSISATTALPLQVVSADGRTLLSRTAPTARLVLPTGIYVVKAGEQVQKVSIQ